MCKIRISTKLPFITSAHACLSAWHTPRPARRCLPLSIPVPPHPSGARCRFVKQAAAEARQTWFIVSQLLGSCLCFGSLACSVATAEETGRVDTVSTGTGLAACFLPLLVQYSLMKYTDTCSQMDLTKWSVVFRFNLQSVGQMKSPHAFAWEPCRYLFFYVFQNYIFTISFVNHLPWKHSL